MRRCERGHGSSPYRACEQGVKGIQPVVHVFLVDGLQENTSVFCAHSKSVGSLKQTTNKYLSGGKLLNKKSFQTRLFKLVVTYLFLKSKRT